MRVKGLTKAHPHTNLINLSGFPEFSPRRSSFPFWFWPIEGRPSVQLTTPE